MIQNPRERFRPLIDNGYDPVAYAITLTYVLQLEDLLARARHVARGNHPGNFANGVDNGLIYEAVDLAEDVAKDPANVGLDEMGCVQHIEGQIETWRNHDND